MAKKNQDSGKPRSARNPSTKCLNTTTSPIRIKGELTTPRLNPGRVPSPSNSQGSSLRTSPGLLAGHYAGCKFTEPPLPSALPKPPQHWMQQTHAVICPFIREKSIGQTDIAQQLKVLLKVQA